MKFGLYDNDRIVTVVEAVNEKKAKEILRKAGIRQQSTIFDIREV